VAECFGLGKRQHPNVGYFGGKFANLKYKHIQKPVIGRIII
jgi:hypothetical protein